MQAREAPPASSTLDYPKLIGLSDRYHVNQWARRCFALQQSGVIREPTLFYHEGFPLPLSLDPFFHLNASLDIHL